MDALLREALVLYPAWGHLVEHVSLGDPAVVDPHDIYGAACTCERDRLAALLYGQAASVASLVEAGEILDALLGMAREGRRPRFANEIGLNFRCGGMTDWSAIPVSAQEDTLIVSGGGPGAHPVRLATGPCVRCHQPIRPGELYAVLAAGPQHFGCHEGATAATVAGTQHKARRAA